MRPITIVELLRRVAAVIEHRPARSSSFSSLAMTDKPPVRTAGRSATTGAPGVSGARGMDGRFGRAERKMKSVGLILSFLAIFPLVAAANANRKTSLVYATAWAIFAWAAWILAVATGSSDMAYVALSFSACAGVAVLGARRPGAAAWNFVVVGLLVVLALPIEQSVAVGTAVYPNTILTAFLATLIGLTVVNYLPTSLGLGAAVFAVGCYFALMDILATAPISPSTAFCLGVGPWAACFGRTVSGHGHAANRVWLSFRDRFGLVWGLRVREQFNRSAENAGLASRLGWKGIRPPDPAADEILAALTKRFF
jgi:hypothetical protein